MASERHALPSPQFCFSGHRGRLVLLSELPELPRCHVHRGCAEDSRESLLGPGLCLESDALGRPIRHIPVIQEGPSRARAAFRNGLGFQRDSWSARVETLSCVFPQSTHIAQLPPLPSPRPPALSSTQISNLEARFAFSFGSTGVTLL